MKLKRLIFGERSLTKVAAVFDNRNSAEHAAEELKRAGRINPAQVNLVGPGDTAGPVSAPLSRKLEPEQNGIWHTLIRAHVVTGTLGAILGVLIYIGLILAGNDTIRSSPFLSLFVHVFFGTLLGMMLGGFLTLRPDHYRVISLVRRAVAAGRWAVVVHPSTRRQIKFVLDELHHRSKQVVRSL